MSGKTSFVVGVLAGLVIGAGAFYGVSGRQQAQAVQQAVALTESELQRSRQELVVLRTQNDVLLGELAVQRSTLRGVESALAQTQRELGNARDKLAFYEQLLPPGPTGAVSVRGLEIQRQGSTLFYKVLLMRNGITDESFQGRLQFVGHGRQGDKAVNVVLEPARAITQEPQASPDQAEPVRAEGVFDVRFTQFQRSSGWLGLPPDVAVSAVTLNVLEGDTVRATQRVEIPDGN